MTPKQPPAVPTEIEEQLYGVDPHEFVGARSEAAKELRREGTRDVAAAVAKLPKPSVAAGMVNRVARDKPDTVGDLLDAGARLREVQLGAGSAEDLRAATEEQQAALRAVMREIEKVGASRGSATAATLDRVRETLHAAALDADLAERVRRGVLVREQRAMGFPTGVAIPVERRRAAPAKRATTPSRPRAPSRSRAHDEVAAKRLERAAAAAEAAQETLSTAEADLTQAKDQLDAANDELATARQTVSAAEGRADDARRTVGRSEKAHAKATQQAERAIAQLAELREEG